MSLSNTESDLLRRLTVALERSAAADEKRNDLLVTDAAERRLTWAASEARSEAAIERIAPQTQPAEEITARRFTRWFLAQPRGGQADFIRSLAERLSDLVTIT